MLVGGLEVLLERSELRARLLQLVDRDGVRDGLNQASILARGDDVEGLEPELEAVQVEDVLELRDHLRRELLLLQVVPALHDAADQAKALLVRQPAKVVTLCDLQAHFVERFATEKALRFQVDAGTCL